MFMLCSLFIKEKLYIGEATVATICGVIFGPHAANLINPLSWGNTDQITLEFSRIVLVVQCFAVGVELPKAYMEKHWRSVVFLLVPVMTFGWLITSLFIWWMIVPLSWLESLAVAACVTATDPVLASSVVGKGKFAKRVPKHLRDVLSAESGCNDGMAFPFIYLSVYLLRYNLNAREVIFHWTCYTILYECIFGAIYGFIVGYIGRKLIRAAENAGLIDRESFLVFYFTLALFCAGSGSLLGMDDLLIGFSAGVGFSNDGSYQEKTEESHVSNVIDLLLNLAYFVYFGTIIPWDQFNSPAHGITPWRLVVIALMVIFFRRIPAMLLLKPLIPDVKTWREALFAGHFGPVGVGAIFAAILARAELETESSRPLAVLPPPGSHDYDLILLVWPVVTFLVLTSILVHGSSIAVFTLGRRINTLALTLSYTREDEGPSWMTRLPRLASSKSTGSFSSVDSADKPVIPQNFLSRLKEGETPSRSSSIRPEKRKARKRNSKRYQAGGPVDPSAFGPLQSQSQRSEPTLVAQESTSDTLNEKSEDPSLHSRQPSYVQDRPFSASPSASPERGGEDRREGRRRDRTSRRQDRPAEVEVFEEGHHLIVEDEEGNVLSNIATKGKTAEEKSAVIDEARQRLSNDQTGRYAKHKHEPHAKDEGEKIKEIMEEAVEHPQKSLRDRLEKWGFGKSKQQADVEAEAATVSSKKKPGEKRKGAAYAYQFGNTLIVEDEDGEVIKKYDLPPAESDGGRRATYGATEVRRGLNRLGTYVGIKPKDAQTPVWSGLAGLSRETAVQQKQDSAERTAEDEQDLPDSDMGGVSHRGQLRKTEQDEKKRESQPDEDDDDNRLRITISKTDRYGWSGLHKEKMGQMSRPGPLQMGGGRRMSMQEMMKHLQTLDAKEAKSRPEAVQEEDNPEDQESKEAEKILRWTRQRATTAPSKARPNVPPGQSSSRPRVDQGAPTDYFSLKSRTSPLQSPGIDMETPKSPSDETSPGRTPAEQGRAMTTDTELTAVDNNGDDDDPSAPQTPQLTREPETPAVDIPSVDFQTLLARRMQVSNTAAAARRQRLSNLETIRSASDDEDELRNRSQGGFASDSNEANEPETAAERRRRLAALQGGDSDSSDSEEDGRPRVQLIRDRVAAAVSEPDDGDMQPEGRILARAAATQNVAGIGEDGELVSSGSGPTRRLQWAGDIGRERELTREREEAERERSGNASDGKGKGRAGGLKRLLKR